MDQRRFKTWMLPVCAAGLLLATGMLYHSLSGGQLVGCGTGSGCDSVTGSPWAWVLGGIPVSLPAAVTWLLLGLCVLFFGGDSAESRSLDRLLRPMMAVLGGCLLGAALWFGWLQLGVLHAFCKYCTLLHVLGCAAAALVLILHLRGDPGQPRRSPWPWFAAGLAAAAVFALVQTRTLPDTVYDSGRTGAPLPTFEEGDLPVLGESGSQSITLLFDFQCSHCRRLHSLLPELLDRAGGQMRIQLCPVPLSSACNPYIPAAGTDRFAGSCALTRYALAVWFTRPEVYAGYWDYLMGDGDTLRKITPAEAESRARELLGEGFEAALADPRIDACIRRAEELFGRTATTDRSGVPRLIHAQRWLVPEVDDADALLALIRTEL